MNDEQKDSRPFHLSASNLVTTVYGPYAFGLVTFLTIWLVAIKPELKNRSLDFDQQRELLSTQREMSTTMEATEQTMKMTAVIMERTVSKMEAKNEKSN